MHSLVQMFCFTDHLLSARCGLSIVLQVLAAAASLWWFGRSCSLGSEQQWLPYATGQQQP
jgi:hypothetical protein